MSVQIDITYTVDLLKPMELHTMPTLLFTEEEMAHRFLISVTRGAEKVSLSGAEIKGYFIRGDNATHELTGSVDEQGRAVVVLDKECYAASGRVQLAILAAVDGAKSVIFAAEGGMHGVTSDSFLDSDNIVPSLSDLLEQIEKMEQATADANAAADKANNAVGPTPNLTIGTVTTLDPGSKATATITGTPEDPVLNLGIPRGVDGDGADGAVQSVNGKTGAVILTAADLDLDAGAVGALPISGGTLTGAQAVGVKCVRNIFAGFDAIETVIDSLEIGEIYMQFEQPEGGE